MGAELLKHLDHVNETRLSALLNQCFAEKRIPADWKSANIVSIFKGKGSPSDPASYRPISLLNTLYKVYTAMLQKRSASEHDNHLRETQYGFRANRSTQDPLFIIRKAQDLSIKTGSPLHFLFLDWKMAFDKVDLESMLIALERLGVHRHYLEVMKDLSTSQTFTVKGFRGGSVTATPHTGIRQGCPAQPLLIYYAHDSFDE